MKIRRVWCSRGALIAVTATFLASGIAKISDPQAFRESILDYQLVTTPVATALAYWLPFFEVTCALALLVPSMRSEGRNCIIALLLVFLAALLSAICRELDISCGCFGPGHPLLVAVGIDMALLAACVETFQLGTTQDATKRKTCRLGEPQAEHN